MLRAVLIGLALSPLAVLGLALLGWLTTNPAWFWWPLGLLAGLFLLVGGISLATTLPRPAAAPAMADDDTAAPALPRRPNRPARGNLIENLPLRQQAARWRYTRPG